MPQAFYVVLITLVFVVVLAILVYNKLISFQNRVREGASDIDIQLKRRYDLIPNLINTVKGSTNFEQQTMEKVIQARQQAINIRGLGEDRAEAETLLSGSLKQLFALSENYPDLKSNQNFLQLQEELTNTEDRILASRRFYNQVVTDYNTYQNQFPALLFKNLAKAKPEPFFELENPEKERQVPQVNFES